MLHLSLLGENELRAIDVLSTLYKALVHVYLKIAAAKIKTLTNMAF
jgi:hypothetical protein